MYEQFYGLRERAFDLTPNPRFLLLTPTHEEALSTLEYGVTSGQGITVLIGEAGTGKTTVLRRALIMRLQSKGPRVMSVYLNNPTLTREEFLQFLALRFELGSDAATSKVRLLAQLEDALRQRRQAGEVPVLVVDEAQSLPRELLEEIRLLSNLETDTEKSLPIVMAGQPELAMRLNSPELRQLKQRIALRCTLKPLSLRETAAYVAGRVRLAGGNAGWLFARDAIIAIFEYSQGVPRTISVICDNALLNGFALQHHPVDAGLIADVCRDFDLERIPLPARGVQPPAAADTTSSFPIRQFIPSIRPWPETGGRFAKRAVESQ